jgi:hypothetical protein
MARAAGVEEAAARVVGLTEVELGAAGEDACVVGFGCEDRFVYRFRSTASDRTGGSALANANNFATHLTMVPECHGDLIVYKIDQSRDGGEGGETRGDEEEEQGARGVRTPLTPREVWELIEYRYLLSRRGLISDRVHRTNMQKSEALVAFHQSNFHDLGDLGNLGT